MVITNGADILVDNALTTDLIAAWQRDPTVARDTYTFSADLIYPVLLAYIADESRP